MSDLLYVNAYSVTRHFGGREEGGWWFNAGEPLASIPIKAKRVKGHGSWCGTCDDARQGKGEFCKKYFPTDEEYEEGLDEDDNERYWDPMTHEVDHLVPVNEEEKEKFVNHLKEMLKDEEYGNIYHSTGGAEIQISVQDHPAEHWPQEAQRYS